MEHLAIIADGNRRWAKSKNLPIQLGYLQAFSTIENCCEWAIKNGVKFLSFFCFSTENWGRPKEEIERLKGVGIKYIDDQKKWYLNKNIQVCFKGRRDRLDLKLVDKIVEVENLTKNCSGLKIFICVDYGGKQEIVDAFHSGATTIEEIDLFIRKDAPIPDAILRPGGECRLSNFMIWQAAYAELFFIDTFFPDLNEGILDSILLKFNNRKRNYGK